jgi:hypothetical protein
MSQREITVNKFILSSKKYILLREARIEDVENVAKIAGKIAGDNMAYMQVLSQKELLKRLLVGVGQDGQKEEDLKKLTLTEKENINALFTLREYTQAVRAVNMMTGGEQDEGNLVMESVTFGGK